MATASTPALGNAFKKRKMTIETGKKTQETAFSDDNEQGGHATTSPWNQQYNVLSCEDFGKHERPQTTKFGDRRHTQQPF